MLSKSLSPIVTGVVTPRALMISGTVFEWPTTRTLPLLFLRRSMSSGALLDVTIVTVSPSAFARGAAVCCVRLNSVA